MDRWEAALERLRTLESQIIKTPATSLAGVTVKLRIATHYLCESDELDKHHATPARDIDFKKECIGVQWEADPVISALLDAERLAGVS